MARSWSNWRSGREDPGLPHRFPRSIWRQVWYNNTQKQLNREIRHRTDVVSFFPNRPVIPRLVGTMTAKQVI